jgi:hypothetical protein
MRFQVSVSETNCNRDQSFISRAAAPDEISNPTIAAMALPEASAQVDGLL